jgi:single-strand DNA-binding protein
MNSVNLTGNLTSDPELRTTETGSVVKLRVALQRRRGGNGEERGADFVDIIAFNNLADNCAKYLTKGRKVAIVGRLHHSEWDSDKGRRQRLEVIADNVEFFSGRQNGDTNTNEEVEPATPIAA